MEKEAFYTGEGVLVRLREMEQFEAEGKYFTFEDLKKYILDFCEAPERPVVYMINYDYRNKKS